jgi:hypothetical protein
MKLSHAPKYHPEVSPESTLEPTAANSGDTPLHQNAAAAIEKTSATVSFKTIEDVPGIGAITLALVVLVPPLFVVIKKRFS